MLSRVQLSKCQLVVIFVVQDVQQVCKEWMDFLLLEDKTCETLKVVTRSFEDTNLNLREVSKDLSQLVMEVLLCKLDLPHVKGTDPRDLVLPMNYSRSLPLCS